MFRLFVYGTLKQGGSANDLLQGAVCIGKVTTHPRYHLYRIGTFPGMVVGDETGGVTGELFEVDDRCLKGLDQYEGVPYLFRREEIDLSCGVKAWAYLYNRSVNKYKRIMEGEWEE